MVLSNELLDKVLSFSISSSCTSPSWESSGSLNLCAASATAKWCSNDSYTYISPYNAPFSIISQFSSKKFICNQPVEFTFATLCTPFTERCKNLKMWEKWNLRGAVELLPSVCNASGDRVLILLHHSNGLRVHRLTTLPPDLIRTLTGNPKIPDPTRRPGALTSASRYRARSDATSSRACGGRKAQKQQRVRSRRWTSSSRRWDSVPGGGRSGRSWTGGRHRGRGGGAGADPPGAPPPAAAGGATRRRRPWTSSSPAKKGFVGGGLNRVGECGVWFV